MLVRDRLFSLAFVVFLTFMSLVSINSVQAQPYNCTTANGTLNVLAPNFQRCAPRAVDWTVGFGFPGIDPGTNYEIQIFWDNAGDQTNNTILTATWDGSFYYSVQGSYIYPKMGLECTYELYAQLIINGSACTGANSEAFSSYVVWDDISNPNLGDHNVDWDPTSAGVEVGETVQVCLNDDRPVRLEDASTFNCTPPIENEPLNQNQRARWVQWVYGTANNVTTGATTAEKIIVNGVEYTNADLPIYGVPEYLPANVVAPNSLTDNIQMPAIGANVGEVFEVTLRSWNVCNPFDNNTGDGDGLNPDQNFPNDVFNIYNTPPGTVPPIPAPLGGGAPFYANDVPIERTFDIVIVDKPIDPVPTNPTICNGDIPPPFTINAFGANLEVEWYQNSGGIPGAVIPNGANSLTLDASLYQPGGPIMGTVAGVYTVWAAYNANNGTQNCWSDPVPITLTIREALAQPGAFVAPVTTDVCNNTLSVPFVLPAVAGSGTPGGSVSYRWRATDNSNVAVGDVIITPQVDGVTALVDFNMAPGFGTAIRKIRVRRRYDTAPNCPSTWREVSVTVYEETAGGVLAGNQAICQGQATSNISLGSQLGSIIRWEVSVNGGGFVTDPGLGVANPINPVLVTLGTHEFRSVVQNGPCLVEYSTNIVTVTVNPNPNDITADVTVITPNICQGDNSDVTVNNTQNDVDYILMNGATVLQTIPGNGALITFNTGPMLASANLDIVAVKNDGTGCQIIMGPFPINVTPTLVPSFDMGPDQVICTGQTPGNLAGSSPTGGTGFYTYQWQIAAAIGGPWSDMTNGSVPEGAPINVTSAVLSFGGTIVGNLFFRRAEFSGQCQAVSNVVSVVVSGGPPLTGVITTGPSDVCEAATNVNYVITGATGASPNDYTWIIPFPAVNSVTGTSGTFNSQTSSINVDFPAAAAGLVITVLANNGCGPAPTQALVTVNSNPTPVLLANQQKTICSGLAVDWEILLNPVNVPALTTFDWPVPVMSDASGQGSAGAGVPAGAAGTLHITDVLVNVTGVPITATYTITPTGPLPNLCPGIPIDIIITVQPSPVILPNQLKTICSGEAVDLKVLLNPDGMPPGTVYDWGLPIMSDGSNQGNAGTAVPASNALTITDVFTNNTANPITATYSILPTGPSNCLGVVEDVIITINPIPIFTLQPLGELVCENLTVTFTTASTGPASTLQWERSIDAGFSYQPQFQGVGPFGEIYSDPTLADLTIDNLSTNMNGYVFRLVVTSTAPGGCSVISDLALLSVSPDATVPSDPVGTLVRCQGAGSDAYTTVSNFAVQGYNWWVVPAAAGTFRDEGSGVGIALTDIESITWADDFFGTADIFVEAVGCSSTPYPSLNPVSVVVNPTPTTTPITGGNNIVAGEDNVCVNSTYFYVVDPPGGDLGSSYTWTLAPLDGNEPVLSTFGNLISLDFQATAWTGTLEVVEIANTCPGPVVSIIISSFPGLGADAGPDVNACEGQVVQLGTPSATGGSGEYAYLWSPAIGLNDPSVPQPLASPPLGVSPITYQLTVTDTKTGCGMATDMVTVTIDPAPSLSVTPSVTEGCSPLLVNFNNNSTGVFANKWFWRLKGTTDENDVQTSFLVSYELSNNTLDDVIYEVVYEGSTGICTNTVVTEITVYPELNADFTIAPGNIVTLDNSTITITNTTIDQNEWDHLWDFGDGTTSTDINPLPHTYTDFGDYNLTLTITDPESLCQSTKTEVIRVQAILPKVDFEADVTEGCRPLTVNFTNLSVSVDPDSYQWEFRNSFGDIVARSTEINPTITFYDPGIINVTLSGSNPLGVTDSKTELEMIEIYDIPTASFVVRPTTVFLPDQLLFTSNLSGMADEFMWDFDGDNEIDSEEFEPTHKYNREGVYDISLIAINSETTCRDTLLIEKAVKVIEAGVANIPNGFFPGEGTGIGGSPGGPDGSPGGSNTVFLPRIKGVRDDGFIMQIFDRWGHLVFESRDKNVGWNGRDKSGRLYASAVYVYKLELVYVSGEHSNVVGDVTLIR